MSLERTLEIGSYQTAWAMLQRLRSVLVRPQRQKLAGRLEVDVRGLGRCKVVLGVERAVIENAAMEAEGLVVHARLHVRERNRCAHCGRRCSRYDRPLCASLSSCKQFRTIQNRLEVLVENTGCGANALVGHCMLKLQHAEAPIQPV